MSKIDSRVALDELLLSQEKREALVASVKRLANDATALKSKTVLNLILTTNTGEICILKQK